LKYYIITFLYDKTGKYLIEIALVAHGRDIILDYKLNCLILCKNPSIQDFCIVKKEPRSFEGSFPTITGLPRLPIAFLYTFPGIDYTTSYLYVNISKSCQFILYLYLVAIKVQIVWITIIIQCKSEGSCLSQNIIYPEIKLDL
jgi:hypothetical protein